MNGFGCDSRETGHSLEPAPPHRMIGNKLTEASQYGIYYGCAMTIDSQHNPQNQYAGRPWVP